MRTGILGGTFDPPHLGHLSLATTALTAGNLEQILLIPASIPPHKSRPDISSPADRLAMTKVIAASDDRLLVSDCELLREGPSYTIETVRELMRAFPGNSFRLIVGSDMAMEFGTWREATALLHLSPPLIAERPGSELPPNLEERPPAGLTPDEGRILQLGRIPFAAMSVSSTAIRAAIRNGEDPSGLLTPGVRAYISEHGLYL